MYVCICLSYYLSLSLFTYPPIQMSICLTISSSSALALVPASTARPCASSSAPHNVTNPQLSIVLCWRECLSLRLSIRRLFISTFIFNCFLSPDGVRFPFPGQRIVRAAPSWEKIGGACSGGGKEDRHFDFVDGRLCYFGLLASRERRKFFVLLPGALSILIGSALL